MTQPPIPSFSLHDLSDHDLDAFARELDAIGRNARAAIGSADLPHLRRIERVGRTCTALGLATCWIAPNPVSAVLLSIGRSTRWLLMHHIGHRGYDRVPGVPDRYTSRMFARGRRRFLDWADWILPEAWVYEHNVLHHSHTGEDRDPDLIERNSGLLRERNFPMTIRYALLLLLALTWRSSYYAPNTLRTWLNRPISRRRPDHGPQAAPRAAEATSAELTRMLWGQCYLPYAALHFAALPLAFSPLGLWASFSALCNSLMAEALTNLHTFCVVGPNHTGSDLYRFAERPRSRPERYLHQIIGSANFRTGSDWIDFPHLWLNYQIEHHLWPDLPMLRYREVQPKVQAVCAKYGVPYVQEGVFRRVRKMMDVAVGNTSMRWFARMGPPDHVAEGRAPARMAERPRNLLAAARATRPHGSMIASEAEEGRLELTR